MLHRAPGGVGIAAPVAAAVALLACGGCAGSAPAAWRGSALSVVRRAADRTIAAGTARVAVTLAQNTAGTGVSGTGEVDFAAGRASLVGRPDGGGGGPRRAVRGRSSTGGRLRRPVERPRRARSAGDLARSAVAGRVARRRSRARPQRRWRRSTRCSCGPGAATAVAFLRGAVDALPYGGQEIEAIERVPLQRPHRSRSGREVEPSRSAPGPRRGRRRDRAGAVAGRRVGGRAGPGRPARAGRGSRAAHHHDPGQPVHHRRREPARADRPGFLPTSACLRRSRVPAPDQVVEAQ